MITKPTVLVLGAGASMPYGMPSGADLKNEIWRLLLSDSERQYSDGERFHLCGVMQNAGFNPQEMKLFAKKLRDSPRATIDAFLACQPQFAKIGKASIALGLLLFYNRNKPKSANSKLERAWYHLLYEKLGHSLSQWHANKLSIVTFNYDCLLERYLREWMTNDFDATKEQCDSALTHLGMLHIYGKISTDIDTLNISPEDLVEITSGLRVINESENEHNHEIGVAYDRIMDAERICFLGFGYDPINVKLLRISNKWHPNTYAAELGHPDPPKKIVGGTTYDMNPKDISRVIELFDTEVSFPQSLQEMPIDEYLRHSDLWD